MKKEWKPEELRETAETIRTAVMPKSITPEMVGGSLLAITDALGEVTEVLGEIPREHVRVKVRGYDGRGGVSGAGATVWLDVFHTKGYPCVSFPRQEFTADENGVVEFDIPHGYRYAVFSQITGLGASFQMVKVAAAEKREICLWNLPIGVRHLYLSALLHSTEDSDIYRGVPMTQDHYVADFDWDDERAKAPWGWDADPQKEECFDDYYYYGVLVSTAETSFVIGTDSKSEKSMQWSGNRDYGTLIPGIPAINYHTEEGRYLGDYEEAKMRACADMDGNMNTAKILDYAHNPIAANFCADYIGYMDEQRWLPSAGQAYLIYLNRAAINALIQERIDAGETDFALLPVQKANGSWTSYEYWWTSTVFDDYCSWVVYYYGNTYYYNRYFTYDVRAVSAFHFEY